MNANTLADELDDIDAYEKHQTLLGKAATMLRQQQAEIESLKAGKIRAYDNGVEDGRKPDTNNKPVAWMETYKGEPNNLDWDKSNLNYGSEFHDVVPLYTHPVKEQLSNGHLSDCAIHNEPASKNKDCDCGFELKFNLADLKHEDNCRYFDDELYCNCGADSYALVEWYRHKEVTHPVKELTEKEKWLTEIDVKQQALKKIIDWLILEHDTLACTSYPLRKAQEKC